MLHSHCKRCGRNIAYLWRLDNPEYNKQYRDNNKEYFVKYSKQYYKDNPEYFKQYCQDNKEHHNNYNKQWYKNNKEHKKQYYQDNKEHYSKYHKQYRKDNRGKRNATEAKRKTLKLNQTVFLTEIEKKAQYQIGGISILYIIAGLFLAACSAGIIHLGGI